MQAADREACHRGDDIPCDGHLARAVHVPDERIRFPFQVHLRLRGPVGGPMLCCHHSKVTGTVWIAPLPDCDFSPSAIIREDEGSIGIKAIELDVKKALHPGQMGGPSVPQGRQVQADLLQA